MAHGIHLPVAEAMIVMLLVGAAWLKLWPPRIDRARALTVGVLAAAVGLAAWAAYWLYTLNDNPTMEGLIFVAHRGTVVHLFGVDRLSAWFALVTLVVSAVAVLGAERARLNTAALAGLLLATAANLLVIFSRSLWFMSLGMLAVAWLVPTLRRRGAAAGGGRLMARTYLGLGALALLGATVTLAVAGNDVWAFAGASALTDLTGQARWVVLGLGVVAVLTREAVFPFHGWFVTSAAEDPAFAPATTLLPHIGVFLVLRVLMPSFPSELAALLPLLAGTAALSALVLALRATVQRSFSRAVSLMVLSQSALVLVGIEAQNMEGVAGGLIAITATSIAGVALLVTSGFATSRTGDPDLRELSGLGASTPRLASAFLAFGLAMVAFPGTVGFIGEDLLFHGAFEASVPAALAIIVAAALNGYMVLFVFSKAFLGPRRPSAWMTDLMPLETVVVLLGLLFVVGFGLFPQPLLWAHEAVAEDVSAFVPASAGHGDDGELPPAGVDRGAH